MALDGDGGGGGAQQQKCCKRELNFEATEEDKTHKRGHNNNFYSISILKK